MSPDFGSLKFQLLLIRKGLQLAASALSCELTLRLLDGKTYDALIKEVDYNPLAHTVEEVDFQALVSNEMVHSTAEIILENEEKVMSGVLQDELKEVAYKALPADLVDKIKVDVAGMKIGDTLRVKDLEIAKNKNIHITTDPEAVVATVTPVHNVVPETETEAEETAEEK